MSWEQHKYAVERARDLRRKWANEAALAQQGVSLQSEANSSDAELLDDVAEFLASLQGSKAGDCMENPSRAFIDDWNKMVSTISVLCGQYDLPKPTMVFDRRWNIKMRAISLSPISDTIIYAGVKIRFGTFEQADVLRP